MERENTNSDNQLLTRVSQGDELAFRQLIYLHSQKVLFHALTFTKSWPLAEEMVQDIFLRVWQKRDKLPLVDNWDKYLYTLSKNVIINAMQKKWLPFESGDTDRIANSLRPDDQHDNKELGLLIEKAISQLTKQKQTVFRMIHLDGLTQDQVSRQLGIATRTVRWNLVAAINEIRDFLHRNSINIFFLLALTQFYSS